MTDREQILNRYLTLEKKIQEASGSFGGCKILPVTKTIDTERILFLAKFSVLPSFNRQDLFRAMLGSYLRHFAQVPEDGKPFDLAELTFKPLEQILDPASAPDTWKTPLQWSGATDYLPAKVPISYLKHRFGVIADDNAVNKFRKDFYKAIRERVLPHYSADDIKEILLQQ